MMVPLFIRVLTAEDGELGIYYHWSEPRSSVCGCHINGCVF